MTSTAMQRATEIVEESQLFPAVAIYATGSTILVVFEDGVFHVCDNGEEVDARDAADAIRIVAENIDNAERLEEERDAQREMEKEMFKD